MSGVPLDKTALSNGRYFVKERVTLEVGPFDVHVVKTEEGIVIDLFPRGSSEDCIDSMFAYDLDAEDLIDTGEED